MNWENELVKELNLMIELKSKRIENLNEIISLKDQRISILEDRIFKLESCIENGFDEECFSDGYDEGCGHDEVSQDDHSEYRQLVDKD